MPLIFREPGWKNRCKNICILGVLALSVLGIGAPGVSTHDLGQVGVYGYQAVSLDKEISAETGQEPTNPRVGPGDSGSSPLPTPTIKAPDATPPGSAGQRPGAYLSKSADDYDALSQRATQRGVIRVIVALDASFRPEGALSAPQADRQRLDIAQKQQRVLDRMATGRATLVKRFKFVPFMVVEVDAAGLESLAAQSEVIGLYEDLPVPPLESPMFPIAQEDPVPPLLSSTIPLIGANNAFSSGFTGSGQVVAVLDTGVDKTHPFLSGKVVSEACFSTTSAGSSSTTVCPNDQEVDTSSGSGVNCPLAVDGCDHGTHVAGIAAGNGSGFSGVGKDANIIAIQVFSRIDDSVFCQGSPTCAGAFPSDLILGLERVFELRSSFNIASVNMSLGAGLESSACDDGVDAATKAAVDNLRSAGIVTVAASGNDGSSTGISSPACISSVVSVGATNDSDAVASFTNCNSLLDVHAPGVSVNSSVPGGGFDTFQGTSMATPHVAGAWALARSKSSQATVDEILAALKDTGVSIADTFCPTKPRIRVDLALDQLVNGCVPPTGNEDWVVTASCTFTGNATANRNVIVEGGATLTIGPGATLDFSFSSNHLRIENGAKVIIKSGAKIN